MSEHENAPQSSIQAAGEAIGFASSKDGVSCRPQSAPVDRRPGVAIHVDVCGEMPRGGGRRNLSPCGIQLGERGV